MPHQFLNLGWDEWGSIIVICGSIFGSLSYLGRSLLKQYVKNPLDGVRNDLKRNHDSQERSAAALEKRAEQHEQMLHDHELLLHEHDIKLEDLEEHFK